MLAGGAGWPEVDQPRRLADHSGDDSHTEHLHSLAHAAHAGWWADRFVGTIGGKPVCERAPQTLGFGL